MSILKLRKRIDEADKNILLQFKKLEDYDYVQSLLNNINNNDTNQFISFCLKKVCTGKKTKEYPSQVHKLENLINKRLSLVKLMKKIKDKELNNIPSKKRYLDKKREEEIIKKVKSTCKSNNLNPKLYASIFKNILKFSKKEFK